MSETEQPRSRLFRTYHPNETDAKASIKILKKRGYLAKNEPRYSKKYTCWVVYYLPKENDKQEVKEQ